MEPLIILILVLLALGMLGKSERSWFGGKYAHDLSLASRTAYKPRRVMGREEAFLFYKLENWVQARGLGERVFAQVPMGTYLQTPDDAAHMLIRHKRPDYVIINQQGFPVCVVEYQGGGHYQGDAHERDAIKKTALQRANIPLVEIFANEQTNASLIREKLNVAVGEAGSMTATF